MSDPTTVLVDVSDLEVRGDEVDLNMEDFLMTQTSGPTTLKPDDPDNALRQAVAETWKSKAFADVEVVCGVDGGTLLSHRIVLASLSPFLRTVLESDPTSCQHETSCLLLPDVDSAVLSNFLSKICLGVKELAFTNPSLEYLDFHHRSCVKTETNEVLNDDDDEDYEEEDEKFNLLEFGEEEDEEDEKKRRKKSIGGRRKSLAWKFFEKIDVTTAKCRACNNLVKTGNGNTTGMGRHVRRFHPDLYQAFNMSFQLGNKPVEMDASRKKGKRRSVVWNYFIKQDNNCAVCNLCNVVIKTEASNTSGMARHLKRTHPDVHFDPIQESGLEDVEDQSDSFDWPVSDPTSLEIQMEDSEPVTDPFDLDLPKGKMKSKVWNYFERQDKKLAACLNCDAVIKTEAGNTSGMSRHLKRFHPGIWNAFDDEGNFATVIVDAEDLYEEDATKCRRLRSLVWNYYEREDKTTAVCKICSSTVKTGGGNTSGLARHLRRAHPDEYSEFKEASKIASENETKAKKENKKPVTASSPTKRTEPLRDVWKFYDNVSAGYEENQVGSDSYTAVCKFCEIVVCFTSEDMQPLEDHLSSEHQAGMDEYEAADLITNETDEDGGVANDESNVKQLRSAIWKYFKQTNVKTKNQCSECGKVLLCARQNTTSMIRHLERRHPEQFVTFLHESGNQEETLKKGRDKAKKISKDDSSDPTDRTCPECHKVYWHKRAMLYHKKIVHSGERPFKCKDCSMTFARLECFQKHSHSEERKFLCSLCGKTFGRKSARDLHERAHRGDRRYACAHCTKAFMTNQALTKHERTHTGEKPFQCKDCGKQFATKCHLTTHIRIHTGEKPYFCDFCDLKFRHLSSRSKHKCDGRLMTVKWIHPQNQVLLNEENSIIDSE